MADRDKVINGLNCCCHTNGFNCAKCPYDIADSDCTALMSMDVLELLKEQKTGHWVEKQINSYTRSTTCSVCGKSAPFVFVSDDRYGRNGYGKDELTKYCPNCGAKMTK